MLLLKEGILFLFDAVNRGLNVYFCCLLLFSIRFVILGGAINCVRFLHWVGDEKYRSDNEHNKGPLMSAGTKKATHASQRDRTFIPS